MVKSIYLTMLVSYFILFVFLCFTNGSIRYFLQQNMLYILLPMALPLILSLVGLNDLKSSHFGLRKSLVLRQKIKNKSVKSKVNISLLSRLEQEDLQQKLNISK